MIRRQKKFSQETSSWWIGLASLIIGLPSFVIFLLPAFAQKESSQQNMTVGPSGTAVMNSGNNAIITLNPARPEPLVFKQPKLVMGEIDYRDLASPALSGQFIGKTVLFRAVYISEWNQPQAYKVAGLSVSNMVFINHRSVYYEPTVSALGSTDSELPPFPISISLKQLDSVRKLKRGDFVLVRGTVEQPKDGLGLGAEATPDWGRIHIRATDVQLLQKD